ncbi:cAMP-binding domain of CRP or a regulatory subunit of cAMP-dependent protein kinases [Hymenobacter gelipurpurascens]|uniref:cAMP-binding domain of CRP or a regulatory subunit of cAMP-dependent protein kinases n=1 Tax=Hymenobacter gelipurpurascens TaxID=89968 RepID=A0A212UGA1_9BACT|nr:Crp/Fnr family transcriptional regulator [Hymenobacter gelipurpurascens]SNC77200.1 cAMP-binding domain of CRP or a regulatory subunit of cAMP-dependent protein kinases [Hymenobacter gelipurpurascens]
MHLSVASSHAALLSLRALLGQVPQLSEADIEEFVAYWQKLVDLRRGEFLIRPGQAEHHLYFVHTGLLRIYLPVGSEEICVGFGYENSLICSFPSFVTGQASEYSIQALRGRELLGISRPDFLGFVEQNANFGRFWRAELERNLVGRIEREIDLLLPDPAQRYARLLTRSPQLFQRVPKKYIASYLRMTPETLSRLR